jgi:hypothetical protein
MKRRTKNKQKSARLVMRVTQHERLAIEDRADERKLTVSDFLLRCALGTAATRHADVDAINHLRNCCMEVKNLYHAHSGVPEALFTELMEAATAAITRVWENPQQMR